MPLDFFRIDVLPGTEDDYFFSAPGNEQISMGIEVAKVPGEQPAIVQNLAGRVRAIPVPFHDNGSTNGDFPKNRTVLLRWGVHDAGFHTTERFSDRADDVVGRWGRECAAGGFGQAIGLQNVNAQSIEIAADLRVPARAAGDQVSHLVAEQAVNRAEKSLACIPPKRAGRTIEPHQGSHRNPGQLSALSHFFLDPFVNEIEELWHAGEGCDVALA